MKILHLITSLKIGGAESSLCNLLEALPSGDDHVVIYFHKGSNARRLKNTYHVNGLISPYDPLGLLRLFIYIVKFKPDLIHSALWSANIIGCIFSKLLRIPIVCDLHGDVEDHGKLRNFIEGFLKKIPKRFIAVSNSVKESWHKVFGASDKIIVIPNGIDVNKVCTVAYDTAITRQSLGMSEGDFVVGAIGRLEPIKSYDVLIRAFAKANLPRAKLCIIGDGSQRAYLESISQGLGADVIFIGQRSDAISFYPIFNCFVISSQSEGLSIALLESMSCKVPVITTCKSDKHDVIIDGKTGFLVPTSDVRALSNLIKNYYVNLEGLRLVGNNGFDYVVKHCDISVMARRYQNIYNQIVEKTL